ncbi:hypothetical protein [Clostridium pasteurianum]|uniref:Uncharacterized protein n=1 Tax=Clostridium pasteurianum BC1 TaxID=86416 RepID=R4JY34_CLOPA|nr:hypothetical protein [Clostridium pasteurianum]AGK95193.1 hypothetical protein Clopa_0093 [Clostridium pasteurianum BC1]
MPKLKNSDKKKPSKEDIKGSYKFKRIQFNFSFLSTNSEYNFKNLTRDMKADIIDRLCELSSMDLVQIHSISKERGLEYIEDKGISIKAKCHPDFSSNEYIKSCCPKKYCIIRIYPNNNPTPSRILGRLIGHAFYIHFIVMDHKCYK